MNSRGFFVGLTSVSFPCSRPAYPEDPIDRHEFYAACASVIGISADLDQLAAKREVQELAEYKEKAIILLGHGSRVPDAGRHMERVASGLKEKYGYNVVEICYMSRLGPHFPEVFEKCLHQGATEVIVIPYFLHEGLHLVLDIPEMMQRLAEKHPGVRLVLGKNLGFDEVLVDLVERRIADSGDSCDVRDIRLPPRKQFPVPPGQYEFVPMDPGEAAEYLQKKQSHHH